VGQGLDDVGLADAGWPGEDQALGGYFTSRKLTG
jgi:hypothetical protein